MIVSIVQDRSLKYPSGEDYFSPDQAWPEYQGKHLSQKPNPVYAAVRQILADAGLDRKHFGTPSWNPLGAYVSSGNKVFLLCNFVEQKVGRATDEALQAKCTHGSVIRAVADYVLIALQGKGAITFGNAPLQGCDWAQVIEQTGATRVEEFYKKFHGDGVKVTLRDLRQHIIQRSALGGVKTAHHSDEDTHAVKVEFGKDSLLDGLCKDGKEPKFRVLDYDSRRTEKCHEKGHHTYIINRAIIESDVVISVPKLKTHEKVGITCGIKGFVGTVAHKDCLAHHRYGPPKDGGDEMPNELSMLSVVSAIHDQVYRRDDHVIRSVMHSADYFSRKVVRRFTRALSGSWPGNDTCWRMAVDLARVVQYADKTGKLHPTVQRRHIMFTDGIMGGEGDGPLSPRPVPLGYLSFSDSIVVGDYANCLVMGYDPDKLPMIREAFRVKTYPLADQAPEKSEITLNGKTAPMESLRGGLGKKFLPPREWRKTL